MFWRRVARMQAPHKIRMAGGRFPSHIVLPSLHFVWQAARPKMYLLGSGCALSVWHNGLLHFGFVKVVLWFMAGKLNGCEWQHLNMAK